MKQTLKLWAVVPILSVFLLNGCANTDKKENPETTDNTLTQETETAETAKDNTLSDSIVFEGTDMNGNAVSSEVFSDSKLTMVNVWATYCNPCLNEMPGLGELAGEYDPDNFQIIGIISDVMEGADAETMDNATALVEMTGADYTHLLLNESVYYALLTDVTAVPTTFFVNENGEVVDTVIGAMEKTAWEEKINALLENS